MRQNTSCKIALLATFLLIASIVCEKALATDPTDVGGGRLGVGPMAPMTEPLPRYDSMRQVIPGPPVEPKVVSRSASWPGAQVQTDQVARQNPDGSTSFTAGQPSAYSQDPYRTASAYSRTSFVQPVQPAPQVELFKETEILGRVGSEAIFSYEIIGGVNEVLDQYKDKIPPSQIDNIRTKLIKDRLLSRIQSKLIYLNAKSTIPHESLVSVENQIKKFFDSTEMPNMIKRSKVETAKDLDEKLKGYGSSLELEKRAFIERTLAQQWVHQQIKPDGEITYDQMMKYYRDHQSDFETPAQTKWQEIMIKYSSYSSKAEAFEAIAKLGNQVLGGGDFAEVAKKGSEGPTSNKGGVYEWTTKGSLADEKIDQAIFSLPVGQLSQIIEGERGYYIIRVIERNETQLTPFLTAQVKIKELIKEERTNKQIQEFLSKLEDKTPIWTKFDGDRKDLRLSDRMKEMK